MFFTPRLRLAALSLIAASNLTLSVLVAQTRPSTVSTTDTPRQRIEKSIARQRAAVAAMSNSIGTQKRSVARQPRPQSLGPETFRPGLQPPAPAGAMACDSLSSSDITALVDSAAARTSVSAELIQSVMRQESGFRPCAVSPRGAMGLMQLIPGTAAELGVQDAFDPEQNVIGGARLLNQLLNRYGGDLSMTLSAYNAGVRPVDAAGGVPMIPETIDYVSRILSRLPSKSGKPLGTNSQAFRDSAAETSERITGSEGGK